MPPPLKLAPGPVRIKLSPAQIAGAARNALRRDAAKLSRLRRAAPARRRADHAAAVQPLPGPALTAFAGEPTKFFRWTLLPVSAGHVAVLQAIDSPFFLGITLMMQEAMAPSPREKKAIQKQIAANVMTIEDLAVALYIFSRPQAELRSDLAEVGRTEFRRAALAEVIEELPPLPNLDGMLGFALARHYSESLATRLNFESANPKAEGGGARVNFPSPIPRSETGSAGSSKS